MEDTNYCVYLHRRTDNQDIIYVGEGRPTRANSLGKGAIRNKEYSRIREITDVYCEVHTKDLTKIQAEELEEYLISELRAEGHPLTNKNKRATNAKLYLKEEYCDKFYVDPTSPSGLRWMMDRFNLGDRGAKLVSKNDLAGCKNKITGYWIYNGKMCHRIVYALSHGECPAQLTVDHIDNNKDNNSISNLQLLSRGDNSLKSHEGRVYPQGEDSTSSKVTKEEVLKIYKMFENYATNEDIGETYGLHSRYVSLLRHGKRWKELYKEYGCKFKQSSKELSVTLEQVKAVLELLSTKNNVEISAITKVEKSTVSRLRHGKALKKLVAIVNEQNERKYENITEV